MLATRFGLAHRPDGGLQTFLLAMHFVFFETVQGLKDERFDGDFRDLGEDLGLDIYYIIFY